MVTKIQKWGNSQGLRVPREVLKKVSLSVGDEVEIVAEGTRIVVRPKRRIRRKYRLRDLLKGYKCKPFEVGWGPPVGKEVW